MYLLFFFLLLTLSKPAYAYLDPGSGNALIYVVISLIGAVGYAVKSAFYKVVKWKKTSASVKPFAKTEKKKEKKREKRIVTVTERRGPAPVVLLNDDKSREAFMPVIDKLIEKGTPFVILPLTPESLKNDAYLKNNFADLINAENDEDNEDVEKEEKKLVIFGENKNYWPVFKTTAERLMEKKIRFDYLTMDIDDPALTIESDYMQPRYIGDGTRAYYKMSHLSADIMYTTTPNIGTAGYPIARSPNIGKIVFVGHVFGTIECVWLHKNACDKYDEIIASNDTVEERVRHLEEIRNLPAKEVCVCGCPYLDVLNDKLKNVSSQTDGKTVLIGSSWGDKGCLNVYGTDFIERLAKTGYNVIVRPHPQSLIVEKEMIRNYQEKLKKYENVSWSFDVDSIPVMAKSDIMISDVSGVRFDYFALLQRPVLVLEMPEIDLDAYDYGDLREIMAKFHPEEEMGAVLPKDKIDQIENYVADLIKDQKNRNYREIRDKYAFNFGHAGQVIADHLISELNK